MRAELDRRHGVRPAHPMDVYRTPIGGAGSGCRPAALQVSGRQTYKMRITATTDRGGRADDLLDRRRIRGRQQAAGGERAAPDRGAERSTRSKLTISMLTNPAGTEMKVRKVGSIRPRKTNPIRTGRTASGTFSTSGPAKRRASARAARRSA